MYAAYLVAVNGLVLGCIGLVALVSRVMTGSSQMTLGQALWFWIGGVVFLGLLPMLLSAVRGWFGAP